MSKERITIVGGGLVGTLLAVMLSRRGHAVDVYEKRPDMRKIKISAGRSINLALAERGMNSLRHAGLMDQVEPLLIPMRGRLLHKLDGTLEHAAYGQRPGEVIYSISRLLLNQLMLTAAENTPGVRLFFEHECTAIDLKTKQLAFTLASSQEPVFRDYELLLGTDGANSVVRDAVVSSRGGHYTTDWLDHDYKELAIPANSAGEFQMEREALHIWPRNGFMLIALPNLDASFTVTLFLNKSGSPSFAELRTGRDVREFFHQQFPDASQLIDDLERDFFENPTGVLGTVRATNWTDGRSALLLGDAAHAIVPFHGQGMNAGFEDCWVLSQMLDEHSGNWPQIFERFTEERLPNANAIADMALENYITMRSTVLDPKFQLKREVGFELERRFPDRFIPQYSMVMFHHEIPYSEAQRRGQNQDRLLDKLTENCARFEDVNFESAAEMLRSVLA